MIEEMPQLGVLDVRRKMVSPLAQDRSELSFGVSCVKGDIFHLLKNMFFLLVLKGLYHYWKYLYLGQGS